MEATADRTEIVAFKRASRMAKSEEAPLFHGGVSLTDEQLWLRQIYRGEKTAFWHIWQKYQDYLYRRCWSWMGGNYTDAQEALSQAMLKAWHKLPQYADRISNLKAWLTRITHNLCVDLHRKRQREAKSIHNLDFTDSEQIDLTNASDSPESEMLRGEMAFYVRQAVNALPARLHQPFMMRFDREMSYAEIAKKLDISPENARKRIQQARAILQKQLDPYFSGASHLAKLEESSLTQIDFQASDTATPPSDLQDLPLHSIDYRITVSCLESLPPTWYSLSNSLV